MIQLNRWPSEPEITRDEVKTALNSLLNFGWARAYDLWVSQVPLEGLPDGDRFDELYFYITPSGKDALCTFPKEWFPSWNED